jgi:hypothetical protein
MVFDLLHLGEKDYRLEPLRVRRKALEKLVKGQTLILPTRRLASNGLAASKNGAGRIRAGRASHHPSETFLPEQVGRSAKVRTEQIRKTAVVMLYSWPSDVAGSRPSR